VDSADHAAEEATEPPAEESAGEGEPSPERSSMRYRKQRRGGKGVRDIRTTERNGLVVGIVSVHDDDDIMLITAQGMVNRTHVNEIRVVGRNTQGVRIMNLNEGDSIASLAKIAKENGESEGPGEEASGGDLPPVSGDTSTPSEPAPPEPPT
jgi:DNA gyrase subunit A